MCHGRLYCDTHRQGTSVVLCVWKREAAQQLPGAHPPKKTRSIRLSWIDQAAQYACPTRTLGQLLQLQYTPSQYPTSTCTWHENACMRILQAAALARFYPAPTRRPRTHLYVDESPREIERGSSRLPVVCGGHWPRYPQSSPSDRLVLGREKPGRAHNGRTHAHTTHTGGRCFVRLSFSQKRCESRFARHFIDSRKERRRRKRPFFWLSFVELLSAHAFAPAATQRVEI